MTLVDSPKRCPRCHKRLVMEIGAHESRGDLTVERWCLNDDYREFGPSSVESARRTSETFAEVYARVLAQRLRLTGDTGIEIPLIKDTDSWPEEVDV